MKNSSLSVDLGGRRIIKKKKEHTTLNPSDNISANKIVQEITSSENSAKMKFKEKLKENNKIENEKNKTDDIKKSKKKNSIPRLSNKANTMIRKKSSTKISIDGSVDNKTKSSTKIKIYSKQKEQKINPTSTFHLTSGPGKLKSFNYNNIKTRSKYVQNLLGDMSLKKYKQSCIDLLKNDNTVKRLYEQAGFEKTNYSYEYFIQNNFFNRPLFMYKLDFF